MTAGWKTTQMELREGALVLVVAELYSGGEWTVRAFLHSDWHSVLRSLPERRTGTDAIAAAEQYARELGPVEPVLALLRAFARAAGHVRRARKVAA